MKETFPNIEEVCGKIVIPRHRKEVTVIHALRPLQKEEAYDVRLTSNNKVLFDYEIDDVKLSIKIIEPVDDDVEVEYLIKIVYREKSEV